MSDDEVVRYVIIGGGLTAARAVEGIREHDREGVVTVVSAEDHLPYERPPLSKDVLLGKADAEVAYPHNEGWYLAEGVTVHRGQPATSISADARTVALADGTELGWDRLLLATGSVVRRLELPGGELPGVHYLRTLDDSLALLAALRGGGDVVVVGAGWIGLEVAAAARHHGCTVTIVEPAAAPLMAVMGERIGGWFADFHAAHGVELRLGTGVAGFTGEDAVTGVTTDAGDVIPARVVVVGVGITPSTALAETAGVAIDNGVVTDSALRTSVPGIWAAGDVANWESTVLGRHVRVEHWANANDSGLAAGRSMAGVELTYDPVPFFYSDQYEAGLEYAGYVPKDAGAELVVRGDLATNEFMAFWVVPDGDGVRVLAGMHVNVWDTIDAVQSLIRDRAVVTRERLADPGVPLDHLTAS
ncbi:MAG TPA: FAD-dependent oxidoreductase [Propionicimonas sp.]|nr:FAD-dependent oxidoreductase [Propionicimonas sp.]